MVKTKRVVCRALKGQHIHSAGQRPALLCVQKQIRRKNFFVVGLHFNNNTFMLPFQGVVWYLCLLAQGVALR
ncbi:MAG: hypothetical protein KF900_08530 [Bacteroidetes bacterium]|nr:hypothetical protein [Bacteroidota bacterium]